MKKFASLLLLTAIILAVFTGCGKDEQNSDSLTADAVLHSTIHEVQAPEFSFTHIYGDPSQQATWLWVNCDISDAAIVAVNYDEETFAPSIGDVLYSFGNVASGEGILLYMEMPEGFPLYAFSYNANGQTYTYAMGYSGIDGSTTLTDFNDM